MSLLTSLISYWSLAEASGTRSDSHGTNHLTDNNTVTQTTGKVGNCGQFTAANSEYLNIASNASLQTGDIDFTLAAWVYLDSKGTTRAIASKRGGTSDEYALDYFTTSDRFRFYVFNGGTAYSALANTLGSPSLATWYFILGWHDAAANTVNIQVNDGTVDSVTTTGAAPNSSNGDFRVGRLASSFYWDGRQDELALWKRVLTADERTWLYNSGSGRSYADLVAASSSNIARLTGQGILLGSKGLVS